MDAIFNTTERNLDTFGRLRTSNTFNVFDIQHQYNKQPLFWNEETVAGGSSSHLPNESSVKLTVDGTLNARAIRQTKQYFRYQPGKSVLVMISGVMGVKKTGGRQRLGYFDSENGFFFEQDVNNLKIVRRTKTSGSVVDNATNQSDWNIDRLDGSGTSGITIDLTKNQIFVINFQWLGAGIIRYGFYVNGETMIVHEELIANQIATPSSTTGNLPVRIELENTSGIGTSTDMQFTCVSISSEGGHNPLGLHFSANTGVTKNAVTTREPILSAKPKFTFNSIANRGIIQPFGFNILSEDDLLFYEIVLNGTLTGASFVSAGTNSIAQFDIAATAISGGQIIKSGYIAAASVGANRSPGVGGNGLAEKVSLSTNFDASDSDVLSVVCTAVNGATDVLAAMDWQELY